MDSNCDLTTILYAAKEMALAAGDIHLRYFRDRDLRIDSKYRDSDIVTIADKEAEKYIISEITKCFPNSEILSEETGKCGHANGRVKWIIDPLDGTTNFSQGLPMFAVSIGVQVDNRDTIGVVYAPQLGEMFEAVACKGAYLNGKPIKCSGKSRLAEAVAATGFPVDKDVNPDNNLIQTTRITPKVRGLRRLGSAALDLCYVAAGFLDGYWEMNLHEWDVAAGRLIVREAGGLYSLWRPDRGISAVAGSPDIFSQLNLELRNED